MHTIFIIQLIAIFITIAQMLLGYNATSWQSLLQNSHSTW